MSQKRNYSSYYKDNYQENEPVVEESTSEVEEVVEEAVIEEPKKEVVVEEKKEEKKEVQIKKGKVIGSANLNVRSVASKDSKIIGQLRPGQGVVILDDSNVEWFKIQDLDGYVMKKFVELV